MQIRTIQLEHDPRLAAFAPPHVTLIGSSGAGPVLARTTVAQMRALLEPITQDTAPMSLPFSKPMRFIGTHTIVLPLDPHGPLRVLHDRIRKSGLTLSRSRHAFTPHVTLNLYRTLSKEEIRKLMAVRITEPARVDHIVCSLTEEPLPPRRLLELPLGVGGGE